MWLSSLKSYASSLKSYASSVGVVSIGLAAHLRLRRVLVQIPIFLLW